jgi:hypothetical protein
VVLVVDAELVDADEVVDVEVADEVVVVAGRVPLGMGSVAVSIDVALAEAEIAARTIERHSRKRRRFDRYIIPAWSVCLCTLH